MIFCIGIKEGIAVGYYAKTQERVLHLCKKDNAEWKDIFINDKLSLAAFGQLLDGINKIIQNANLPKVQKTS